MPIKIYKDRVEIFDTLSTTNLSISGTISGIDANKIGAASESQLNALSKTVNELSTYTGSLGETITELQQEVDDIALELIKNGVVRLSSWPATVTSETIDSFLEAGILKWASVDNSISNINNDGMVVSIGWSGDGSFGAQIWIDDGSNPASMKIRNRKRIADNTIEWNPWRKIVIESEDTYGISISGNATTATRLNTNAGSAAKPVYFSDGIPKECGTSLAVSITGSSASCTGNAATATTASYTSGKITFSEADGQGPPTMTEFNGNKNVSINLPGFYYDENTKTLNIYTNL